MMLLSKVTCALSLLHVGNVRHVWSVTAESHLDVWRRCVSASLKGGCASQQEPDLGGKNVSRYCVTFWGEFPSSYGDKALSDLRN